MIYLFLVYVVWLSQYRTWLRDTRSRAFAIDATGIALLGDDHFFGKDGLGLGLPQVGRGWPTGTVGRFRMARVFGRMGS